MVAPLKLPRSKKVPKVQQKQQVSTCWPLTAPSRVLQFGWPGRFLTTLASNLQPCSPLTQQPHATACYQNICHNEIIFVCLASATPPLSEYIHFEGGGNRERQPSLGLDYSQVKLACESLLKTLCAFCFIFSQTNKHIHTYRTHKAQTHALLQKQQEQKQQQEQWPCET